MPVAAVAGAWIGGTALGYGTVGAVIGGALGGGLGAEMSGGDFATGALGGALGGFAGPLTGMLTEAGLGTVTSQVLAGSLLGGAGAAITGGDVGTAMLGGALGGFTPALTGMLTDSIGSTAAGILSPALTGGANAAIRGGDFLTGAAMGAAGGTASALTNGLFGSTTGSIFNNDPSLSGNPADLAAYDQATFGNVPYSGSNTMWDDLFSTDYSIGSGSLGNSYTAADWYSPTYATGSTADFNFDYWNPDYSLPAGGNYNIGNVSDPYSAYGAYTPDIYSLLNANNGNTTLTDSFNFLGTPVTDWSTDMWGEVGMTAQPWLTGEGDWGNPVETWTPEQWTQFDSAVGNTGFSATLKNLASSAVGSTAKQLITKMIGGQGSTPNTGSAPNTSGTSGLPSWLPWALGGLGVAGAVSDSAPTSTITTSNTPYQPPWLDAAQQGMARNIMSIPTVAPYYTQPLAAGLAQNQQSGIGMADSVTGAWAPQFADAVNTATRTATTLPETDLTAYMNPYLVQTLSPTLRGIQQQFDTNQQNLDLTAASRGAFGGSRNTLMGGLNEENRARALSEATNKGYSDAYNYATSNALADRNALLGTANTLGNFAGNYQNMLGADVNQLMATGGVNYSVNDALLQRQYQDYLTQLNYPLSAIGGASSALSAISPRVYPNTSVASTVGADPNMWANLFGATSTGVGLLGQMGYFNNTATTPPTV